MSKILVTYWRSDEISANATLNFWDGFFRELCQYGNDVLAINNSFYNIWTSNTTSDIGVEEYLHDEVSKFQPDIVIAFNNRILQSLLDDFEGPVILYDGDELKFFSDLDTVRRDISRYKVFSIVKGWKKDYVDFGFKDNQIFYMPPGTAIRNDSSVEQTMNISFLGQRRFYLSNKLKDAINDGRDLDAFYKTYLDHLKNHSYEYNDTFLKCGGLNSDDHYTDSDLWPLFDDSYLIFSYLIDLGIHLGGHEGGWRDIVDFVPQIAVTHKKSRIFTLEENQMFYNSSKISLNPMHPQAKGKGFSWRSWDIMASNACLVSSYSSELKEATKNYVDLPMFNSPIEAREICVNLLNSPAQRNELVSASQEYIERNCRWVYRFREMEQIIGIPMISEGKVGTFKKLEQKIPAEYNSDFSKNRGQLIYIPEHLDNKGRNILRREKRKSVFHSFIKRYEELTNIIKSPEFARVYCILLFTLIGQYIMLGGKFSTEGIRDINYTKTLENLYYSIHAVFFAGIVLVVLTLLYRPFRKLYHLLLKLIKRVH